MTSASDQRRVTEQLLAAVIPLGQVNVVALVLAPLALGVVSSGRLHTRDLMVWTFAIWCGAAAQGLVVISHRWSGLNRTWERRYAAVETLAGASWGLALAIRIVDGEPLSAHMVVACFLVMTTSAAVVSFAGSRLIGFAFLLGQWGAYAVVAVLLREFDLLLIGALVLSAASAYLYVANRMLVSAINAQVLAGELSDELRVQASTDALTGLLNRRAVMEELQRALDDGHAPTVVFVDLDGFKAINDEFGHRAGDDVLIEAGRRLLGIVRATDLVGRLGGDEFVAVLLPGPSEDELIELASRVRIELSAPVGAHRHCVTASVGCAVATPNDSADRVLGRADALMYQAKQTGGNAIRLSLVA